KNYGTFTYNPLQCCILWYATSIKDAFIILVAHVVFHVPFVGLYISIPFPFLTFSLASLSHFCKYLNCCSSHSSGYSNIFLLYFSGMFDNLYITSVCILPKQ